jgi:hypothetical protein
MSVTRTFELAVCVYCAGFDNTDVGGAVDVVVGQEKM